ncbi:MAG: flavodoxin-dependent (E)-4-hydroxy-3-methylbut-2-enyl-diphosphate synthase [Candidatus Omnitrophota bacterium]
MKIDRKKTRKVILKNGTVIGSGSAISIQSMITADTADVRACVGQIKRLEKAGCEIVRIAVLNQQAAAAIAKIKKQIRIPLVADIHFDYRLALAAIEQGADKIRLNPGNIKKESQIKAVIEKAKEYNVPIRVGLNSGSVKRTLGNNLVKDMVSAGKRYLKIFEKYKFNQIVFSLKTHDILTTIDAYRQMSKITDAPMHLGVTAAGLIPDGIIKSTLGIGVLLLEGIGDTLRVSLTADPVEEVVVGKKILGMLGIYNKGIEIIACPTCGRCKIDLISLVKKVKQALSIFQDNCFQPRLKVAIMGCIVNGPGEAKDADLGIAWGGSSGILFKKGKKIKLVKEKEILEVLVSEVKNEVV